MVAREWRREVSEEPHLGRVFEATQPWPPEPVAGGADFATLALEVFGPLLEHLSTIEGDA